MTINIDEAIDKAFEPSFRRALDQTLQLKAEALFKKAFGEGSPMSKKLEQKIEEGFHRFFEDGIRWEKRNPGFKK
jgi:hypothetical protein